MFCEYCSGKFTSIAALTKHVNACRVKVSTNVNNVKTKLNVDKNYIHKQENVSLKSSPYNAQCRVVDVNDSVAKTIAKLNEVNDEDSVEDKFMLLLAKLYGDASITNTLVNEIVHDFIDYSKEISHLLSKQFKEKLPVEYHKEIDNVLQFNIFEKYNTEYKRLEYFKNTGYLIQPKQFKIGEIADDKKVTIILIGRKKHVMYT